MAQAVYEEMRAEGAVCIADEVQTGFGRVGSHMWAFQTQGVVPDMVTLGKPIGETWPGRPPAPRPIPCPVHCLLAGRPAAPLVAAAPLRRHSGRRRAAARLLAGNGVPMAALVLSASLAAGFCNGMEFFATTGEGREGLRGWRRMDRMA